MAHIRLIPGFSGKERRTGVCSITGNPQKHTVPGDKTSPLEPVVDLDTWIDMEGNLEITLETAQQIGDVVGMLSKERAEDLQDQVLDLLAQRDELESRLADKQAALSAVAGELTAAAQHASGEYARGYEQGCRDSDTDAAVR